MSNILKLLIIFLISQCCRSTDKKASDAYQGYYRFDSEQNSKDFYPMSADQIKDSPLISSMVETNPVEKISVKDYSLTHRLLENTETPYFGEKDLTTSPPIETYFKEEPNSRSKSYINPQNSYSGGNGEISEDSWKIYSNSMPNIEQKSYSSYDYSNTNEKQEKLTPKISDYSNLEPTYEQQTNGNNRHSNSDKNPEYLSSYIDIYPNSQISSKTNFDQKSQSNDNLYTNSGDTQKKWNPIVKNNHNSYRNSEQQSNRNDYSNFDRQNSGKRDEWSPPRNIYKHYVPNYRPYNDESDIHEDEESESGGPLSRLLNLSKNRLRAKKVVMNDFVLT